MDGITKTTEGTGEKKTAATTRHRRMKEIPFQSQGRKKGLENCAIKKTNVLKAIFDDRGTERLNNNAEKKKPKNRESTREKRRQRMFDN